VLNLPGIAVDVDNPPDLQHLLSLPGDSRAQRLARSWNLPANLLATGADAV
jgi:2-phospho-L-lactate guanylyltransferase (CobY/MobA/RfbA family)